VDWELAGVIALVFAVLILIAGVLTFSASRGPWSLLITWFAVSISGTFLLFMSASGNSDTLIFDGSLIALPTGSMALVVAALRHSGRGAVGQTLVAAVAGFATVLLIARLVIVF